MNKTEIDEAPEAQEPSATEAQKKNPIPEAITRFICKARDIKWSARTLIPKAGEMVNERIAKAEEQIKRSQELLASQEALERVHGMKEMLEAVRKIERVKYSKTYTIVETSLFLSLFSAFDEYTGELISAIYERKPKLFDKLNRKVDLTDVLSANSIDDLKRSVLNDAIETFRRKSYVEQFAELENTHGLPLREFERWPDFVECTQRRNLLTHCGGIVSEQYRNICKEEKYPEEKIPSIGAQLGLGAEYFLPTCELMMEVALKLGQTLWRKILPEEIEEADSHLISTQFDALYSQNWKRAKVFGEFAVSQRKFTDEKHKRMCVLNYTIALKFSGNEEQAIKELNKLDWSASINDFRLAEAVLRDRFEDAASIMTRIGKAGEMVREESYHIWPLFTKFRESPEFIAVYAEIYGYPFVTKLKRYADETLSDASTQELLLGAKSANIADRLVVEADPTPLESGQ